MYSKVLRLCGLGALEFDFAANEDDSDPVAEGRRLLERERRRRSEAFEMRNREILVVEAHDQNSTSLSRPLTSWATPPGSA